MKDEVIDWFVVEEDGEISVYALYPGNHQANISDKFKPEERAALAEYIRQDNGVGELESGRAYYPRTARADTLFQRSYNPPKVPAPVIRPARQLPTAPPKREHARPVRTSSLPGSLVRPSYPARQAPARSYHERFLWVAEQIGQWVDSIPYGWYVVYTLLGVTAFLLAFEIMMLLLGSPFSP